jgi:hypothetical protein
MKRLRLFLVQLAQLVWAILVSWPRAGAQVFRTFWGFILRLIGLRKLPPRPRSRCVAIRHPNFKRPDPLIYDQQYLMSLALAVTWDNPDIELRLGGVAVSSSQLVEKTEYEIVAQIWNSSTEAPVIDMPVVFSYLDFGMGGASVPIDQVKVDLGVKGGPACPAYASVRWTTPAVPGHYCIQVRLEWGDDAIPNNNFGQENVHVGAAHSPATLDFALTNDTRERRRYHFEVDTYTLPDLPDCPETTTRRKERQRPQRRPLAPADVDPAVQRRHDRAAYPVPVGWAVAFDPAEPVLAAGEGTTVLFTVTPPDGFVGSQPININGFDESGLVGGITVYVQGG